MLAGFADCDQCLKCLIRILVQYLDNLHAADRIRACIAVMLVFDFRLIEQTHHICFLFFFTHVVASFLFCLLICMGTADHILS